MKLNNSENLLSSTSRLAFVLFGDCFNSWMTHCETGEADGSQVMNDLGDDLTFFSSFLVDQLSCTLCTSNICSTDKHKLHAGQESKRLR